MLGRARVRHPGGAGGLPLFADGRVALVRQYRHPPQVVLLEIPAGTLNEGEDPAACAARELVEEVGLRPRRLEHVVTYYTTPGLTNERMHIYFTDDVEPAAVALDPGEVIDIVRRPVAQLLELIDSGEIVDAKSLLGLSLLALRTL